MLAARAWCFWTLCLLCGLSACADQAGVPGDMQQWNRPFPPYHVIDNVYYVGTNKIAQFLITTSAGNILIDAGFEASVPRLRENVEALGFHYTDIKLVLATHAHIDHVQALARVRQQTGARVVVSALDAPIVEQGGKGDPLFDGIYEWTPCPVDRRVNDGDQVTLGATTLTAHITAGHTFGATTWTMKVTDRGRALDVVFFPSANINPGVRLIGNTRYPRIVEDFQHSFATWKTLSCDVFLADHGDFYGMPKKYRRLQDDAAANPFIDPSGYRQFIAEAEQRFLQQLESER